MPDQPCPQLPHAPPPPPPLPSPHCRACAAIGKNMVNAKTFLEKRYAEDMELEDAIHTALLTLKEGFEGACWRAAAAGVQVVAPLLPAGAAGAAGG